MRLFVAVPLPHDQAERAARLLPGTLTALRHVRADLLHLTLAFLGPTPEERLPDAVAAVREAAARGAPFDLVLTAAGTFPERGRPSVVWLGAADGADRLLALGEAVRAALRRRAVRYDPKPFRPHVTLARVRAGAADVDLAAVAAAVEAARPVPPLRFRVDTLHVIESTLSPRGPRYASREAAPLGGGARGVGDDDERGGAGGARAGARGPGLPASARGRSGRRARRIRPDP